MIIILIIAFKFNILFFVISKLKLFIIYSIINIFEQTAST